MNNIKDFYNNFADVYPYIFTDWNKTSEKHPIIIDTLIKKYESYKSQTLLDCTCGIGTQCLGLSKIGYEVFASDISDKELEIARSHSYKIGNKIEFKITDCRCLKSSWKRTFDVIISFDNALPHLLNKMDMKMAFSNIYNCLNDNGLFISSYRDYEDLLLKRPKLANPLRIHEVDDKTILSFKTWYWKQNMCYSTQYIIVESEDVNEVYKGSFWMWAITRKELLSISNEIGFKKVYWLLPNTTNFFEPILVAQK